MRVPVRFLRAPRRRSLRLIVLSTIFALAFGQTALAVHVVDGLDVKVTNDNNNVDGGAPNPSFDSQNRQSNETTVAISPVNPSIVAAGANDYRLVTTHGDGWFGFYVSSDAGASWFNTMIPGFTIDNSPNGLASPLLGLDAAGDPAVRFAADGDLLLGGIAFNRDFDKADKSLDTVTWLARYDYTPGSPGGTSTPTSAANPPNFTYTFTTIVDKGSVGFANPGFQGFGGQLNDKNWHASDNWAASPCRGAIYYSYTKFAGQAGGFPIVLGVSRDGGRSFSQTQQITNKGINGTHATQGSFIAIAPNGTVYVTYRVFPTASDPAAHLHVVRSADCGKTFSKPVTAATFTDMPRQTVGLTYRTPLEPQIAADDTNSNVVYVTYMAMDGDNADIFVARSTNGAQSFSAPAKVNDDATHKHQYWPTIAVSNGDLHVAWFDLRNSGSPANPEADNNAVDVYYASSGTAGVAWPAFSHNERVTDVSHNGNCRMFGGGTVGFQGDYMELAARWDGANHIVHVVWTDNRDVDPCDLDAAAGPASNNTGNRNQNVYADRLVVAP